MKHVTDQDKALAIQLRDKGVSYREIGRRLGFSGDSIHRAIDPEFAEHKKTTCNRARRRRREAEPKLARYAHIAEKDEIRADAAARLAEIPPDTRDLTGIMFGDPIPGDPRRYWLHGRSTTTGEAR